MAENINRRLNIYINDREVVNSMRGITGEISRTRNELRNLNKGAANYDDEVKRLTKSLSELTTRQATFKTEISGSTSMLQKMKNIIGPVGTGLLAAFSIGAVLSGFVSSVKNAFKTINDFEQGIADLSSITGAAGKDLEYLRKQSIELGKATIGGASAVVEAYKLIASAKPELLENVQALNQVTESVLLLAKASGMEMPAAATALTDAMNQYGVDASQAAVFVDALANGAKYGAAEIPQITEGLLKFGAVARSSNVNIKESVGLVELLAENGLKGVEAGTALRNILLKISAPDALPKEAVKEFERLGISLEFLKDKTIPIQEKLETLKPLLKDNASIIKIFGLENATAAINVIGHTDRLQELILKMEEVGTAEEQAAIKMDTVNSKTELLKSKYDSLILSIGSGGGVVSNFFKFFIDGASDALTGLLRLNNSWDELQNKSRTDGQKEGRKSFDKRVNTGINQGGKEEDVVKEIQKTARKELDGRLWAIDDAKKELEKAKKEALSFGESFDEKAAQRKIEQIQKEIGFQEALIKSGNQRIYDIKNPKSSSNLDGGPLVDEDADKKRVKDLADAKKHSDALLKLEDDLQKELLDSRREAEDLKLGLIKDDYEREKAVLNTSYNRKIEDLKTNIQKESDAIAKLKIGISSSKTSPGDLVSFKKQLQERLSIQAAYNDTLVATNQTRDLKLGELQEKFLKVDFDKKQEAIARDLQNLHTKHDNELASITDLASAKSLLADYLSVDEIKKVHGLEEAKKKIKEQFQKEEIQLQIKHLTDLSAVMQGMLENTTLPPEQREAILKFYDDLAAKIAALNGSKDSASPDASKDIKSFSGIDILGFTPEQWQKTFDSFDTFSEKIAAVEMAVGAVKNAFGIYFQFLEMGDKRSLQKFESSNRKKQLELASQLEKGYITQEVYIARKAKLDSELAKKKAELEYKQAKREKIMAIASILINTAIGVSKALAQGGFVVGIPMAAVVGALGLVQLGLAIAQPLPNKSGFYDGGYTGSGDERSSPGPVHYDEYVVPKKVLFSNDPVVPNIIGYLEAKRQGKNPQTPQEKSTVSASAQSGSGSSEINQQVVNSLNRNSAILEKIEENGIPAFLENDIKTAKKMRDKIKEVTKLESKSKL